jgi:hypothetical protein
MKQSKPMFLILFAVIAVAMSGCGKSSSPAPANPNLVNPQINGGYGGGYGGGAGGNFGSGCTPIQSPIQFSGVMYIDSANVLAGLGAPQPTQTNGQNFGAIQMASDSTMPAATYGIISIQAQMFSVNGANGVGTIQLSQAAIQQAALQSGVPYGQFPCAAVASIQLTHYNTRLYGGVVRLMINGNVPYEVYF